MAQPFLFSVSSGLAPPLAAESAVGWLPAAPRAEPEKWSSRASLGFIFATCGAFWLAAGVLFYTFH
jgi:hypothetical protein